MPISEVDAGRRQTCQTAINDGKTDGKFRMKAITKQAQATDKSSSAYSEGDGADINTSVHFVAP